MKKHEEKIIIECSEEKIDLNFTVYFNPNDYLNNFVDTPELRSLLNDNFPSISILEIKKHFINKVNEIQLYLDTNGVKSETEQFKYTLDYDHKNEFRKFNIYNLKELQSKIFLDLSSLDEKYDLINMHYKYDGIETCSLYALTNSEKETHGRPVFSWNKKTKCVDYFNDQILISLLSLEEVKIAQKLLSAQMPSSITFSIIEPEPYVQVLGFILRGSKNYSYNIKCSIQELKNRLSSLKYSSYLKEISGSFKNNKRYSLENALQLDEIERSLSNKII